MAKKKADEVEKEIAKDQADKKAENLSFTSDQLVTCKDLVTGAVFKSNMVQIQSAENAVNTMIMLDGSATLEDFYERLGDYVSCPDIARHIEWHCSDKRPVMEVKFAGALSKNGTPYLTFTYNWNSDQWLR